VTPVTARKAIVVSLATLYNMRHHQSVQDLVYDLYLKLSENRAVPVDFVSDTSIADHPERLAQYTAGLHVPDTMERMTGGLLKSLAASPVPVTMDKTKAGTLDEYGRPRDGGAASR
jgi:hypothetical protein